MHKVLIVSRMQNGRKCGLAKSNAIAKGAIEAHAVSQKYETTFKKNYEKENIILATICCYHRGGVGIACIEIQSACPK